MVRSVVLAALALAGVTAGAGVAHASAPPNDAFANADVIDGGFSAVRYGTNFEATTEAGEPTNGGHSLWYRWTPTAPGSVSIETCGSTFDTDLRVFTGASLPALSEVASSGDVVGSCLGDGSRVSFTAAAATTYRILVDGSGGDTGALRLTLRPAVRPSTDAASGASVLTGALPATATASTVDAIFHPGDPQPSFAPWRGPAWFTWTATVTGNIVFATCGSNYSADVGVYDNHLGAGWTETPAAPATSTLVCADGLGRETAFAAQSGTTYLVAASSSNGHQGTVTATVRLHASPANDLRANPTLLPAALGSATPGTLTDATFSGDDVIPNGDGFASVWYRWEPTASASGVAVETCGSPIPVQVHVMTAPRSNPTQISGTPTGTEFACESTGTNNDGSRRTRLAGVNTTTTYWIEATPRETGASGPFTLNVRLLQPPANNAFAAAQPLTGALPIHASGDITDATGELNEKTFNGSSVGLTVWYQWTPAQTGLATIETCGSAIDTMLQLFGDFSNFSERNDDGCGTQSRLVTQTQAGVPIYIQVDGHQRGTFELTVRDAHRPANDDPATAVTLPSTAAPVTVVGTTVDALPSGAVYYRWTAPTADPIVVGSCTSDIPTRVTVSEGTTGVGDVAPTTNHASCGGHSRVVFTPTAGHDYTISVSGAKTGGSSYPQSGPFVLTVARAAFELDLPPALQAFSPAGPSTLTTPLALGTAFVGATVRLFTAADCRGPVVGQGTAAAFASPGIPVTLPAGATSQVRAVASSGLGTSVCSNPRNYEALPAPTPTPDPSPPPAPSTEGTPAPSPPPTPSTDSTPAPGASPAPKPTVGPSVAPAARAPQTPAITRVKTDLRRRRITVTLPRLRAGLHYECRVDKLAYKRCRSGALIAGLRRGRHTLYVRAVDALGRADATPSHKSFRI